MLLCWSIIVLTISREEHPFIRDLRESTKCQERQPVLRGEGLFRQQSHSGMNTSVYKIWIGVIWSAVVTPRGSSWKKKKVHPLYFASQTQKISFIYSLSYYYLLVQKNPQYFLFFLPVGPRGWSPAQQEKQTGVLISGLWGELNVWGWVITLLQPPVSFPLSFLH